MAHTDRWGGSYMPSTFETVSQVAHDAENFTSFEVGVAPVPIAYDDDGNRLRSVISSDPPDHTPERRLMLPVLLAEAGRDRYREPHPGQLARRLITGLHRGRPKADAAGDYARQIPPRIIADHPRHRSGDVR